MERIETLVIGAGQAGLAMSHCLSRLAREHLVIERSRVAERWRSQRWDSLMFQFPNWSVELPGLQLATDEPEAFSHKDDIFAFLERYAAFVRAPIRTAEALSVQPATGRRFVARTTAGDIEADNIVVATGPYQQPRIPPWSQGIPRAILQVHAGEYRNAASLPPGAVLVVGSGASGCQIGEEMLEAGRETYFAIGSHRRIPRRYRGRDVFWWRRELGYLDATARDTPSAKRMPPPLVTGVGGGHDIDLRAYARRGMKLLGHIRAASDGRIDIAPDLEESLAAGDRALEEFKADVDAWLAARGERTPEEEPAPPGKALRCDAQVDLARAGIRTIIWATGYSRRFDWIRVPVFDERGEPVHDRGEAAAGLYFLGMPWTSKLKSTFLCGVGEDAAHIAARIASLVPAPGAPA